MKLKRQYKVRGVLKSRQRKRRKRRKNIRNKAQKEIMMWKKHQTNSSICKTKEKKKARITQLKTNKYEGILSKGREEE